MRIELLGPSGAGKSTTLASAMARDVQRRWLAPDDLAILLPKRTARDLRAAIDDPARRDFVNWAVSVVAECEMSPSQKVSALTFLRRSCADIDALGRIQVEQPLVHDELLLHRAFSLLPHVQDVEVAAHEFFSRVELPDAAVIVTADPDTILQRVDERGRIPNVYQTHDAERLPEVISAAHRIAETAATTLAARGLPVLTLDTTADPDSTAEQLLTFIDTQAPATAADDVRARLLAA